MGMFDQDSHDDQIASLVFWILVACTATVGAAQEPVRYETLALMQ